MTSNSRKFSEYSWEEKGGRPFGKIIQAMFGHERFKSIWKSRAKAIWYGTKWLR